MNICQGVDITSVGRVRDAMKRHESGFKRRVFTPTEFQYCDSKRMKYEHFAARFAAKEAFMKAVEVSRRDRYRFSEIEIKRRPTGKPFIFLSAKARQRFGISESCQIELSMAHERDFAIATVLVVNKQ